VYKFPVAVKSMIVIAALAASACTTAPVRESRAASVASDRGWNQAVALPSLASANLSVDGAVPFFSDSAAPLFSSKVSLQALESLLSLHADYSLTPGDVLNPADAARWNRKTLPQSVGAQSLGQEARLRLPELSGAPLLLSLRYRQQDRWLIGSATQEVQQAMRLQWEPSYAAFQLNWMQQGSQLDPRLALDCPVDGAVKVPLRSVSEGLALRVGGRSCSVRLPDDAPMPLDAHTWSAALQWSDELRRAALRAQVIEPTQAAGYELGHVAPLSSAYELQMQHEQTLGDWDARASIAWRRPPAVPGLDDGAAWVADARLRRELRVLALVARWSNGDRLWFVPEAGVRSDDLALSLDLSRWAAGLWPGALPTMELSYQWQRARAASAAWYEDDTAIHWRMSVPWR
jgi:hypothetical protein